MCVCACVCRWIQLCFFSGRFEARGVAAPRGLGSAVNGSTPSSATNLTWIFNLFGWIRITSCQLFQIFQTEDQRSMQESKNAMYLQGTCSHTLGYMKIFILSFGLSFFCHLNLSFFFVLSFAPVICLSCFVIFHWFPSCFDDFTVFLWLFNGFLWFSSIVDLFSLFFPWTSAFFVHGFVDPMLEIQTTFRKKTMNMIRKWQTNDRKNAKTHSFF